MHVVRPLRGWRCQPIVLHSPQPRARSRSIAMSQCRAACSCGAQVSAPVHGSLAQLPRRNAGTHRAVVELSGPSALEQAGHGRRQMIVKAILSAKGGDVISIDPTATLNTAVKTLAEHKIGALLVLGPDRRVIGILSERDIVRALAERGAGVLSEPLAQVMTRNVVICGQTETVSTIMERMTTGKF